MGYTYDGRYSYEFDRVMKGMNKSLPIILFNKIGSGHSWLLDGYRRSKIKREQYQVIASKFTDEIISEGVVMTSYRYENQYTHMNLGWNGEGDGWYQSGVFDCANVIEKDPNCSINTSTHFYARIQLITQIRP